MDNITMLDQSFLWKDRIYPPEEKPDKLDLIVKGRRGRLLCTCFRSGGAGRHPAIVICHGFPGNEKNLDLAAALRRAGFHVLSFHYSGSWGSDGNFSLHNCLEDLETILEMLVSDPSIGADPERIFLWGHSMGGFLSYHTLVKQSESYRREHRLKPVSFRIAGAVLAMPADFGVMYQMAEKDPLLKNETLGFLKEGADWLTGTSGELLYREAAEYAGELKMDQLYHYIKDVPLLWINGLEDDMIPAEMILNRILEQSEKTGSCAIRRADLKTDHMATDRRCELTEVTAEWLIGQCRK